VLALDFSFAVVLQVGAGIALMTALWLFYDRTRRRTTYHCLKCNQVYTADAQAGLAPCPRCGHPNPRLHF
jgi:Zn finger protein HypA/HybF involved in hydrogenase expression